MKAALQTKIVYIASKDGSVRVLMARWRSSVRMHTYDESLYHHGHERSQDVGPDLAQQRRVVRRAHRCRQQVFSAGESVCARSTIEYWSRAAAAGDGAYMSGRLLPGSQLNINVRFSMRRAVALRMSTAVVGASAYAGMCGPKEVTRERVLYG